MNTSVYDFNFQDTSSPGTATFSNGDIDKTVDLCLGVSYLKQDWIKLAKFFIPTFANGW